MYYATYTLYHRELAPILFLSTPLYTLPLSMSSTTILLSQITLFAILARHNLGVFRNILLTGASTSTF